MKTPGFTKKRLTLLVVVIVLLAGGLTGVYFVSLWANTPVEQSITAGGSQSADATPTYQTVRTSFFSFVLPTSFHIQISKDANNPNAVHVIGAVLRASSQQVGVTSNLLPTDGLPGVADYNFRRSTPAEYEVVSKTSLPAGSKAFRKINGPTELTIFLVHGSRYASVTLTGASNSDLQELSTLINSQWQWL